MTTHDAHLGGFRYCPKCATELVIRPDGNRRRRQCSACGFIHYNNPVPAAGCLIQRDNRVLLVRRALPPKVGDWTLPAGFIEYDESAESCAIREIEEETGLTVGITGLLGVYMGFDDIRAHAVLIVYHAEESGERDPVAGDDADDARFFSADEIPDNIAFRAHREALVDALFLSSVHRSKTTT